MKELELIEFKVIEILKTYNYYNGNIHQHFWRKKEKSEFENVLLKFIDIFGFELSHITMINFYEKIHENSDFYFFGEYEANYMVINKHNHKVELYDYDMSYIFPCSLSGEAFLDFFIKELELIDPNWTLSNLEFENEKKKRSKVLLELVGGIEFKNWIELICE